MSKISTNTSLLAAVQGAERRHPWPAEVAAGSASAQNVFDAAQQQRAHRDWPPADLIELARAAKLIALADAEFETYVREGVVIMGGKDGTTPRENPRGRSVATLNGTVNSILRRLGVTAMSVTGKRSQANRAAQEREIRDDLEDDKDDDVRRLI